MAILTICQPRFLVAALNASATDAAADLNGSFSKTSRFPRPCGILLVISTGAFMGSKRWSLAAAKQMGRRFCCAQATSITYKNRNGQIGRVLGYHHVQSSSFRN